MKTYNISDKNKYYRQNNNEINPLIRCKPTATVEALDLAGWPLPYGKHKQPEDNLTEWMESNYGKDSPENWDQIRMAINSHFLPGPKPVIGPHWDWDLRDALFGLTVGIPFVASTWLTKFGHVVNIVGYMTEQNEQPVNTMAVDLSKVKTIIIDDPYGDRTSGVYDTKKSGFNNHYEAMFFIKTLWRGTGIQVLRRRG